MSNDNTNLKTILDQPMNRIIIAVGAIALFFIIIIWIVATQYDVNTTSLCFSVGDCANTTIVPEPIIITPLKVALVSGGISTVALGVLIGVGFLELPIVFALAGGAAFATLTYTAFQILY
ncbi:hypothetical protein VKI22_01440 [Cyanobacterium aponinum UTEX 3221]|uniref:hypothetical protein n=1 Tax=Cyanobacterium aponinum TaxID=379064 RepID=UPI002B4C1BBB|nr:hypothetical protein [Cyanobacterium aponinum]WRL38788.1 hypothetical protein VKI22_01440 [Cyanobacterium aponinum UTEX 3221]